MINCCNPLDCFVSDLLPGCHRAFIARSLEDIRIFSPGVSPTAGHFDFISPVFLQGVIALIAICDKDPGVSFQIVSDNISCSGAVINIVLDAVFVLIFKWGMYGAAAATVIGQIISTIIAVCYLLHYRTVKLERKHFIPNITYLGQICSLGMASAINQVAMMIVQITMNNLLKKYGAQSAYGDAIPIACAGIVMKVNHLYFSVIIGLSQGSQPIQSFNYGARQYKRVKDSYRMAVTVGAIVSIASFLLFQIYPREILRLFGNGTKEYFDFGIRYFRVFLLFCLIEL